MIQFLPLLTIAPPADARERPLPLWEVRKGERVSWLLGTCHVPVTLDHMLPEPYVDHLRHARVFVTELDLESVLDPEVLMAVTVDPARDLRTDLGEESFRAYSDHFRGTYPAPLLVRMPPWALAGMLEASKFGGNGQRTVDEQVAQVASDAGVPSVYLETFDEQLALMNRLNEGIAQVLTIGSSDFEAASRVTDIMYKACFDGSLGPVEAAFADEAGDETLVAMLDARNKAWHDRVWNEVGAGNAFISVGLGHMIGPTGLVAQAQHEGYTVTRLTSRNKVPKQKVPTAAPMAPVPADPAKAARWSVIVGHAVPVMCEPGRPGTCFTADGACEARMSEAIDLCIDQQLPSLPADPSEGGAEHTNLVVNCAVAGVAVEGLVAGVGADTPSCVALRADMRTRMVSAMSAAIQSRTDR